MLSKDEYYERVDMKVYREIVKPVLSDRILDMHAHIWLETSPDSKLGQYMEYNRNPYTIDRLLTAVSLMFPEQTYHALLFGSPEPRQEYTANAYIAGLCRQRRTLYPLYIPDMRASEEQIKHTVREGAYYGFKPYWNLVVDKPRQDDVTVLDMLPVPYMRVAEEWGLIIMLHIPGSRRLADPTTIEGIQKLVREYPNAKIVIAHLGRSYCPWSIDGIRHICDLPNVFFETSFVQEALVFKKVFDWVDPAKLMYGTDLPISEVRGRRVCINNNWVDVSRESLSWTAFIKGENAIQSTFMTYEMIRAMREGAEAAGISTETLKPIFFENGMRLIGDVRRTLGYEG